MTANGFRSHHFLDDGKPSGGSSFGTGFAISWQHGPLGRGAGRKEPNGAFVEDVIAAAMDRIDFYQGTEFECDANERARHHLGMALEALQDRTSEREARQVEGTHQL